jgi:pimeloyl-ACP methyl ester carboxylesterase
MLQALPNTSVRTYTWDKWRQAYKAILVNQGKAKIVLIGYSGGGSRATWLANMPARPQIDLMISYDPSPRWQMKPIRANVKKALCYHNIKTMWLPGLGDLGGGQLVRKAPASVDISIHDRSINTIDVAEHHMLVQIDQRLHRHTVEAVRSLARAAPEREFRTASLHREAFAK